MFSVTRWWSRTKRLPLRWGIQRDFFVASKSYSSNSNGTCLNSPVPGDDCEQLIEQELNESDSDHDILRPLEANKQTNQPKFKQIEFEYHKFPSFQQLKLSPFIWPKLKFKFPSPIQKVVMPFLCQKITTGQTQDVIIQDMTGSGKTLAFLGPILGSIDNFDDSTQAVIMCPTKELVVQCYQLAMRLNRGGTGRRKKNPVRISRITGMINVPMERSLVNKVPHMIIGTPHSLHRLFKGNNDRAAVSSIKLKWLVLDEADHLIDTDPSSDAVQYFMDRLFSGPRSKTPLRTQAVLISAFITPSIVKLARKYLYLPQLANCTGMFAFRAFSSFNLRVLPPTLSHYYVLFEPDDDKLAMITKLHATTLPMVTLVFVHSQQKIQTIVDMLKGKGFRAAGIHNNMPATDRAKALKAARQRRITFLVCTEMMSRGMDIGGLTHILNYDPPFNPISYLHRAGRVGRLGAVKHGVVISLVKTGYQHKIQECASQLDLNITEMVLRKGVAYVQTKNGEREFKYTRQQMINEDNQSRFRGGLHGKANQEEINSRPKGEAIRLAALWREGTGTEGIEETHAAAGQQEVEHELELEQVSATAQDLEIDVSRAKSGGWFTPD